MSMGKSTGRQTPLNADDADAAADAFKPAWAAEDADEAAEAFKPAWAAEDDTSGATAPAIAPASAIIVGAPVISVGVSPEATKPLQPAPGVPPPPDAIVATMQSTIQSAVSPLTGTSTKSTTLGISPGAQALVDAANAASRPVPTPFADTVRTGGPGSDTVVDVERAKTLIDAKAPTENAFSSTAPMLERPAPPKARPVNGGARPSARPVPIAAVDPFRASPSDEVDLSVIKPKTSKAVIFGGIAVILAVAAVAVVKLTGQNETASKPAEPAASLAATTAAPTNDIPPPPPREEVTPPPAAPATTASPAKTAEMAPKAPEPTPVTHAPPPRPEPRVASGPARQPRTPAAPSQPKTPPKPAGGGIVRDSPF
jgi:hypothetical protein